MLLTDDFKVALLSIFVDDDLDGFVLCLLFCLMYYGTLNV
jgi:hypothetical protein